MRTLLISLLLIFMLIFTLPVKGSFQNESNSINVEIYPVQSAYFDNQEVQVNYLIHGENGRELYGGKGFWSLRYFLNGTEICHGNFTLPSGTIGFLPDNYFLDTDEYSIVIEYEKDGKKGVGETTFFILNHTKFYYEIYVSSYEGRYLKVSINDAVNYPSGSGIYYTIAVPNLPVDFLSIYSGNSVILNKSEPFTLNSRGYGEYFLKLPEGTKSLQIVASVSGKMEKIDYTVPTNYQFYFNLPKEKYLSGEYLNLSVVSAKDYAQTFFYRFYLSNVYGHLLYFQDGKNATLSYKIPVNYQGSVLIRCDIYNDTQRIYTLYHAIQVRYAFLYIYLDKLSYQPGQDVKIMVNFESIVMKNVSFIYRIFKYSIYTSTEIYSRETQKQEITFHVPENPPQSYYIEVTAITPQYTQKAWASISLAPQVLLHVSLLTKSSYTTGIFTPGEKIDLAYSISGNISDAILYYGLDEKFYESPSGVEIKSSQGTIEIMLPENIKSGVHEIHFLLKYRGGEVERDLLISVNTGPSWVFYNVMGVPLGFFLMFVILIVILIVLVLIHISSKKLKDENMKREIRKEEGKKGKSL